MAAKLPTQVRFAPPHPIQIAGYDLDKLVVACDPDTGAPIDLAFELGRGYEIFRALPIAPGGHLRLFLVDCAVYVVDVAVVEDPFTFDLPRTQFTGDRHAAAIEVRAGAYTCTIREPERTTILAMLAPA